MQNFEARVALRPLTVEDVGPHYVGWLADPEVNRYLESRFAEQTPAVVRAFVEQNTSRDDVLFLAIVDRESGRHIGNVKVGPVHPHHGTADLGILIGEKGYWGKGYATEAIRLATTLAFERPQIRKLTASCYGDNVGSARAFERAGWTREGRRPAQFLADGEPQDQVLFGILRPSC